MDLESMIRAQIIMCLKKYIADYTSPWKMLLSYYLEKVGGKFILQCHFDCRISCPYLCLGFTKTVWMPGPFSQGKKCFFSKM